MFATHFKALYVGNKKKQQQQCFQLHATNMKQISVKLSNKFNSAEFSRSLLHNFEDQSDACLSTWSNIKI